MECFMSIKYGYAIDLDSDTTATKVIKMVGHGKFVLEVGCSHGYMSRVLAENYDCRVVGVEIDPRAAEIAEAVCEHVICGNIETLDFKECFGDGKFDVVIFSDVLEHLVDPWDVLERVGAYLKEDGHIVASIPNISHISVISDLMNDRFEYRRLGLLDNTHLRFFTERSVHSMLEGAGYHIAEMQKTKIIPQLTEIGMRISDIGTVANMKAWNPNWDTYQFVLKARRMGDREVVGKLYEELNDIKNMLGAKSIEAFEAQVENDNLSIRLNESISHNEHLQKDIDSMKSEVQLLLGRLDEVSRYSEHLEKDIESLKNEIRSLTK
jgi:O-antigen biosynthesis protein